MIKVIFWRTCRCPKRHHLWNCREYQFTVAELAVNTRRHPLLQYTSSLLYHVVASLVNGDQRSIRACDLLLQLALFSRRNVNCHIRSRVQNRASLSFESSSRLLNGSVTYWNCCMFASESILWGELFGGAQVGRWVDPPGIFHDD
jgi:hypothetical protein